LRLWHRPDLSKSTRRCAITTLPDRHESGTFRAGKAKKRRQPAKITAGSAY
jgi:hypothetical protein